MFSGRSVHDKRKIHDSYVGNVRPIARDYEFPARRNCVIARVFKVVAPVNECVYNHVVVGILRKAQALSGKTGSALVNLKRSAFVYPKIYFGVYYFKFF